MVFRDGPLSDIKVPLAWTGAAAVVVAGLIALGLLITDQRQTLGRSGYGAARGEFDEVMEPVSNGLAAPVRWTGAAVDYVGSYFFAISENRRLRAENAELRRWKDAAIALKNVNDRYESLLKLRTEPPIPSVAARVVQDTRGPFSNARLADAGAESGIRIGYPVVSEHGVVGRIVGVTKGASRILLLTDVDSRTPVMVERTNARAILTGDGGSNPKLDYIRGIEPVKDGDLLLTSGDGGVYPRGLPVGVAARDLKGGWRARLFSDRAAIDYVRILQFSDLNAQVAAASLNGDGSLPPLTGAEQADLQAALAPKPALLPLPNAGAPGATPTPAGGAQAAASGKPSTLTAGLSSPPSKPVVAAALPMSGKTPSPSPTVLVRKPAAAASTSAKPTAPHSLEPKARQAAAGHKKPAEAVAREPKPAASVARAPRPAAGEEEAVRPTAPLVARAMEPSADDRATAALNARAVAASGRSLPTSAKPGATRSAAAKAGATQPGGSKLVATHHRSAARSVGEGAPSSPRPASRPAPADIPF